MNKNKLMTIKLLLIIRFYGNLDDYDVGKT